MGDKGMCRQNNFQNILTVVMIIFVMGCQGNPMIPGTSPASDAQVRTATSDEVHHCLGYYALIVDMQSPEITVVPIRSTSLHLNITGILNSTMGVSAVGIPSEHDPANGLFVFDITLTHPFSAKPQFAGFDVKGILMTPGSLTVAPLVFADADETRLENADGYTRWWNPTEFTSPGMFGYTQGSLAGTPSNLLTAMVNPYKLFADILGPTDSLTSVSDEPLDNPEGRAVFTAGSENTRRYRIRFPMNPAPVVRYGYAIDAAREAPSPNPPAEIPDDFPMNANQPEAWRISMLPDVNTLYYDTESGIGGGVLRMRASVYDWQGQAVGNIHGEVNIVRFYSPDLSDLSVDAAFQSEQPQNAIYTADLTGDAVPTQAGQVVLMCRVGSNDGSTYQQTGAPAPSSPLSAFQVMTLDIPDPDCVGDANNDWSEAVAIDLDSKITDQVCLPDDYRDYYSFQVPAGVDLSGAIDFYCDAEPTTIGIYDSDQELIHEESVSDGLASISVDTLPLFPGSYFIRVYTSNNIQVAPYYLDMGIVTTDVTPTNPVEVTPETLFCNPNFVWRYMNWLVMFGTSGLWIYDGTVDSSPELVTAMPYWGSWTATFSFPMIYYIHHENDGDFLCGVDISDIQNPVIYENIINYGEHISALTMNSEHLFVAYELNYAEDLLVYDWTSNHALPALLDTGNIDPCEGMTLLDPEGLNTTLVTWSGFILSTLEAEDPHSIIYEGAAFLGHDIMDVAVQGSMIYAACSDVDGSALASVLKMEAGPVVQDEIDLSGSPYCVSADGDFAFVGGSDEFTVIDISDSGALAVEGSIPAPGYKLDALADGSDLYFVNYYDGFDTWDITYPPIPEQVYNSMLVDSPYEGVVDGDHMYVIDSDWNVYNTLKSVDISDPSQAYVADEIIMTTPPMAIALGDGFLVVFSGLQDVIFVDIGDPADLTVIESLSFGGSLVRPAVYEGTLYLSAGSATLYIYDVTNPASPVYKDTKTFTNTITRMVFSGDYMYALTTADTVETYSISNPYNPVFLDSYSGLANLYDIAVVGDYLYINAEETFDIADIGDPADLVYAGSVTMPGTSLYYRNMATDGHFAYFCGNKYSGPDPAICSGWPPESPSVVYTFTDWPYSTNYDIQVSNGHLYLFSAFGIRIFDLY